MDHLIWYVVDWWFRWCLIIRFFWNSKAKYEGQRSNKWLLVNIQDPKEFSCQVLNRDVWSNSAVKDIINEHFIFWQVCIIHSFYFVFINKIYKFSFINRLIMIPNKDKILFHSIRYINFHTFQSLILVQVKFIKLKAFKFLIICF